MAVSRFYVANPTDDTTARDEHRILNGSSSSSSRPRRVRERERSSQPTLRTTTNAHALTSLITTLDGLRTTDSPPSTAPLSSYHDPESSNGTVSPGSTLHKERLRPLPVPPTPLPILPDDCPPNSFSMPPLHVMSEKARGKLPARSPLEQNTPHIPFTSSHTQTSNNSTRWRSFQEQHSPPAPAPITAQVHGSPTSPVLNLTSAVSREDIGYANPGYVDDERVYVDDGYDLGLGGFVDDISLADVDVGEISFSERPAGEIREEPLVLRYTPPKKDHVERAIVPLRPIGFYEEYVGKSGGSTAFVKIR